MSESIVFSYGCGVVFLFLAGCYIYVRQHFIEEDSVNDKVPERSSQNTTRSVHGAYRMADSSQQEAELYKMPNRKQVVSIKRG